MERWKEIAGVPGYQVSCRGRMARNGKLLRPASDKNGYYVTSAYVWPKRFNVKVHAAVLSAFTGPRPEGHVCRHLNGDKLDNRVENLAWGTQKENVADTVAMGRQVRGPDHSARVSAGIPKGQSHHNARLSDGNAVAISMLAALPRCERPSQDDIALVFKTTQTTVYQIWSRKGRFAPKETST